MKPYLVCFGKYGLELLIDLEQEKEAFEDYVFNKIKSPNTPIPMSRINTAILHMKNHEYKELEAWAFKSDMERGELWDMFEEDYQCMVGVVQSNGIRVK